VHACEGKTISAKTLGDEEINERIKKASLSNDKLKKEEMKKPLEEVKKVKEAAKKVQWRTDECELRHRAEVIR